jgi:hypothetical protein
MTRLRRWRWWIGWVLGGLMLVTSGRVTLADHRLAADYTDPFKYCAAMGTADRPDSQWRGPRVPVAVARAMQKAFGVDSGAPLTTFLQNTYWRCMNGKVYACSVGVNIPCMSKARTDRAPTPAIKEFCQANPRADAVPAYVTGHDSIYLWGCKSSRPYVVRQINEPDARGLCDRALRPPQDLRRG